MQKHSVKCATAAQKNVVRHIFKRRFYVFLAHLAKGRQGELLSSRGVRRPSSFVMSSVNFSHFNLIL
jgi:hypothetical protein